MKTAALAADDSLTLKNLKTRKPKKDWMRRAKTRFKILASAYQIISQFESALSVRYPPVFEEFGRKLSAIANLDALKLAKVGCLMSTNFYHKLIVSTLGPFCVSVVIFAVAKFLVVRAKDHVAKQHAPSGPFRSS